MRRRYRAFREAHGYKPWKYYKGRERWTPLPREFARARVINRSTPRASRDRKSPRSGLVTGSLLRLLQRLFEPARERIVARLLSLDRLLEERLAPRRLRREDPRRIVQLRLVAALGHRVTDHATEVDVDRRATARSRDTQPRVRSSASP